MKTARQLWKIASQVARLGSFQEYYEIAPPDPASSQIARAIASGRRRFGVREEVTWRLSRDTRFVYFWRHALNIKWRQKDDAETRSAFDTTGRMINDAGVYSSIIDARTDPESTPGEAKEDEAAIRAVRLDPSDRHLKEDVGPHQIPSFFTRYGRPAPEPAPAPPATIKTREQYADRVFCRSESEWARVADLAGEVIYDVLTAAAEAIYSEPAISIRESRIRLIELRDRINSE